MPWADAFKVSWILTLLRISTNQTPIGIHTYTVQFCFRIDHWFGHGANIKVAHPIACDVAVRRFFWAVPGTAGSRLGGSSHLSSWENHQQSAVIPDLCAYRCQMHGNASSLVWGGYWLECCTSSALSWVFTFNGAMIKTVVHTIYKGRDMFTRDVTQTLPVNEPCQLTRNSYRKRNQGGIVIRRFACQKP